MPLSLTFRQVTAAHRAAALSLVVLSLGAGTASASMLPPVLTVDAPMPTTPVSTTPTVPATTPTEEPTTPPPAAGPDIQNASDAPPGTLTPNPTPGTNLVPINERITLPKPLGPSLAFRSAPRSLDTARKRGLRVKLDVAGAVSLKVYAILSSQAAEHTTSGTALADDDGDVTLARTSMSRPASGTLIASLRFGPSSQDALMRFAKVRLTVRLVAADARGHRTVTERALDLS